MINDRTLKISNKLDQISWISEGENEEPFYEVSIVMNVYKPLMFVSVCVFVIILEFLELSVSILY